MTTDVTSDVSTTISLIIDGGPVQGETNFAADSDWYRVSLTAGVTYLFESDATSFSPLLTLRDANGVSLYGGSSVLAFTAEQSGTYYLDAARDILSASGNYTVSASTYHPELGPGDVAGSAATTAVLNVGSPAVSSTFEDLSDSDWYSVHLEAGHTYEFLATNGLGDVPYIVLRDAAGNEISHSLAAPAYAVSNLGILNNNFAYANIVFTAAATGDYFLDVQDRTLVDTSYEVQVHEFVPSSDPLNTILTTNSIAADGVAVAGIFESAGDSDWYGIDLTAGVTYSFTIDTTSFSTLMLRDQNGIFLDFASVDVGTNPTFTFTPTSTGHYFLDASTRSFGGGSYQLIAQQASATPGDVAGGTTTDATLSLDGVAVNGDWEEGPDSDWYSVTLTAGTTYQFNLYMTDASGPLGLETRAALGLMASDGHEIQSDVEQAFYNSGQMTIQYTVEQSGTYYLDARNLFDGRYALVGQELSPIPGDIAGYGANQSLDLAVNGISVLASIDDYGDRDWYAVSLVAGHTYRFTTTGEPFSFPELELRTENGNIIAQAFGNGSSNASDPQQQDFTFTARMSGTYYLDLTGAPGSFELSAKDLTASTDVAGDVTTSETLDYDVLTEVELGSASDEDWYAVQVQAGQSYSVRLASTDFSTAGLEVHDANGLLLEGSTSNFNQNTFFQSGSSFSHFTASETGTYYIAATDGPGVYMLDVVPDDYGDNADWTGTIGLGVTDAAFENFFDADFFDLNVQKDKIYTVSWSGTDIKGALTIDGHTLVHLNEPFTFTATDSPTKLGANYFGLDPTASYSISLTERTDIVDEGNTTQTAALIQLAADTNGSIDAYGDHDMFKVNLSAGQSYSFDVALTGTKSLNRFQFDIKDASGHVLASSNSFGPGVLHFYAPESGSYYLDMSNFRFDENRAYDETTGTYRVRVTEDSAALTPAAAIDGGTQLASTTVKVYFAPSGHAYPASVVRFSDGIADGWSAQEKSAMKGVIQRYESAVNIHFVEVSSAADANFVLVNDKSTSGSFFGAPGSANAGLCVFGNTRNTSTQEGSALVETYARALGTGLGLRAPAATGPDALYNVKFASDIGLFGLNQTAFTVMGGNHGWQAPAPFDDWPLDRKQVSLFGHQAGPAALDLAVLQAKYGANVGFAHGNDVYTLQGGNGEGTKWQTIWDTGGTDEIRNSGFRDSVINLKAATVAYSEGGGGFVSNVNGVHGGLTIAKGVSIENARGGTGNDVITGNALANRLLGGAGGDHLDGGPGNDVMDGGTGSDTADYSRAAAAVKVLLMLTGNQNTSGAGTDQLISIENLTGSDFADQLSGNRGDNMLDGGKGDDRLAGEGGSDTFAGGLGNDVATGGTGGDIFVATRNDGNDRYDGGQGADLVDLSAILGSVTVDLLNGRASGPQLGIDQLISIENARGGSGDNNFIAGNGENDLAGGDGRDLFIFRSTNAAGILDARDQISDYSAGDDMIDFKGIDANLFERGDQAFTFVGEISTSFFGLGLLDRGSLGYRYTVDHRGNEHTIVEGNIGLLRAADFQIDLVGHHVLTAADFVL